MMLLATIGLLAMHSVDQDQVKIMLCTPVASDLSRVGDYVLYRIAEDAHAGGTFIPAGTPVVGKVQRQSKRVAFSLTRVLLKGDALFGSPRAVISVSADYVTMPDGRTMAMEIDPSPRTDGFNERNHLTNEFWPQQSMSPPNPARPLSQEEKRQWERLFKVATDKNVNLGEVVSSKDSGDFLHTSLASMRDVLALRQTVTFLDEGGASRLQAAADSLKNQSFGSLSRDKATTSTMALTFAAAMEVTNLYGRTHRGIRGWERRKQLILHPGIVMTAHVIRGR